MVTRVSLSSGAHGQITVNKVALDGDLADRSAEASWLERADHPGVVRLISFSSDPATIVTAHSGTRTLRTQKPKPQEAARILAQVSSILADLHTASLVHGKVTLDHICLSGAHIALCSPSGTDTDPTIDLKGLSRATETMMERWQEEGIKVDNHQSWVALVGRLAQTGGAYGARRAVGAFTALGTSAGPQNVKPGDTRRRFRPTKRLLAASLAGALLAGVLVMRPGQSTPEPGTEFAFAGSIFSTGTSEDLVATTANPCPGLPSVAMLEARSGTVWGFNKVSRGENAVPFAAISGATAITFRAAGECNALWLSGPAGEVQLEAAASSD